VTRVVLVFQRSEGSDEVLLDRSCGWLAAISRAIVWERRGRGADDEHDGGRGEVGGR
jgi:hypothetical protein